MRYVIHCQSVDELVTVCAALLSHGVFFDADTHSLTVVLLEGSRT